MALGFASSSNSKVGSSPVGGAHGRKRLLLFVALLVLLMAGAVASAYIRPPSAPPPIVRLDGRLLVAGRQLADPNFRQSVIFMLVHNEQGALGLVVNRVYGTVDLRTVFGDLGIKNAKTTTVDLHYGGPVQATLAFILHSPDYTGEGTHLFRNGIAFSTGPDIVRAVAEGRGPKRSLFLAGYAGWGAGQLDQEMARGDWLSAPADPELVFSNDPDTVWEKALQRAGISL